MIQLEFENTIQSDSLSVLDYHYLYNGGGVGIADFNGDGHQDIFLGGNLVSSRCFSGDGALNFLDVTEQAGLQTTEWINGVSLIDINSDGKKDIYLSVGGPDCQEQPCYNLLYLNKCEGEKFRFQEVAGEYGLDISGYSQQGLFFDADRDGDLDLYQLQNFVDLKSKNYPQPKRYFSKKSFDKFLENTYNETGVIGYIDRSEKWNVKLPGFGLGIALTDFNQDGYPDLYIANDFITDDILYINEEGKRFVDRSQELLKHTSYNSMGVDIGDVNGDALPDVMVVDMLPYENGRQKTMLGKMNYDKYLLSRQADYNRQFIRNTVQLNNGQMDATLTAFSDVSAMYGLHETDWSWSPLIMDFDNDGDADVYVSNGYGKNITDLDFVNYNVNTVGFGDKESLTNRIKKDVAALPDVTLPNHIFVNQGNGHYDNLTNFPNTITNGVAYGDLDNDGDLDLVQNNINDKATILINNSSGGFIKVKLEGTKQNLDAIGARVELFLDNGKRILRDQAPTRSYLSTMSDELVIGIDTAMVDSIKIYWPDGSETVSGSVQRNATAHYIQESATPHSASPRKMIPLLTQTLLAQADKKRKLKQHDFSKQPLLSKACFDQQIIMEKSIDNSTVYVGNYNSSLCKVNSESMSDPKSIFLLEDFLVTDMSSIEVEGKENLIVVGYNEKKDDSILMRWILSSGEWIKHSEAVLPSSVYKLIRQENINASTFLYLTQYPDPKAYPINVSAPIQKVILTDKIILEPWSESTSISCPTDIKVVDLIGDEQGEFFITGEWMSPLVLDSAGDEIGACQSPILKAMKGLWQDVEAVDLDGDGDLDLILANIGSNTRYDISEKSSLQMVIEDLDGNGRVDPLLSMTDAQGNTYCYHSRDDITSQLPKLKKSYGNYQSFAKATFDEVLGSFKKNVKTVSVSFSESIILENRGNCDFKKHLLPLTAQQSIINNFTAQDLNDDGLPDLIAMTNSMEVETHNGCIDGLNGLVMINEGDFKFRALSTYQSGMHITEASKDCVQIEDGFLVSSSSGIYHLKVADD